MTKDEAEKIAKAVHILRPDWPAKQILDLIGEHYRDNVARDIAVALMVVASDPESRSPSRLLESGEWWRIALYQEPDPTRAAKTRPGSAPRQPKLHEAHTQCPDHPGEYAANCRSCAADKLAEG